MSDNVVVLPDLPAPPPQVRAAPPAQPAAPVPSRADAWKAEFFRVRGWKSNAVKHRALKGTLDADMAKLFRPGRPESAANLAAEKLNPGSEFKDFLKCLDAFEKAPSEKAAGALAVAAGKYISHYNKHSSKQQTQPDTLRKFEACQKTLGDLATWSSVQDLGTPPWNSTRAMEAATIKAELDFASLPLGGQTAESLDGKGVNPTFWVNRAGSSPDEKSKTYLFKPATDKQDRPGIPSGGEPAREALTGRAAEILNAMTGIDFKVPETHIIKVERKRFDGINLTDAVVNRTGTGPLVGSLQQFAPSKGELRANSPTLARAVSPERCQELAILDIITMNADRHGGNFMVDGDDESPDLIPIDNGLSFPDAALGVSFMSSSHNALLRLPGSHEPFTPAMRAKIAKIDPAALQVALKSEVGTIDALHPTAAGKVSDVALDQSRRSAMFLKLAAPTLTPAMVQVALGLNAAKLFDPAINTDAAFAVEATRIIAATALQQAELTDYFQMSSTEQSRVSAECTRLGWDTTSMSAAQMFKIFKAKAQRPAAPNNPQAAGDATPQEVAAMLEVFPTAPPGPRQLALFVGKHIGAWRTLTAIGDISAIKAAVQAAAAKINNIHIKSAALFSPTRVLDVMREQKAADDVAPVTTAVGKAAILANKRDLINDMVALLPGPSQAPIKQRAEILFKGGHQEALDGFRDQVVGALRNVLLKEVAALKQEAASMADGPNKTAALKNLIQCDTTTIRQDLNLFFARKSLDDIRAEIIKG